MASNNAVIFLKNCNLRLVLCDGHRACDGQHEIFTHKTLGSFKPEFHRVLVQDCSCVYKRIRKTISGWEKLLLLIVSTSVAIVRLVRSEDWV